jgi:hypothetical protein
MPVIAAMILGAVVGAMRARAQQGNRLDMAQYGAAHAMAFGILALLVTIGIDTVI